jgi:hypothetical protein
MRDGTELKAYKSVSSSHPSLPWQRENVTFKLDSGPPYLGLVTDSEPWWGTHCGPATLRRLSLGEGLDVNKAFPGGGAVEGAGRLQ